MLFVPFELVATRTIRRIHPSNVQRLAVMGIVLATVMPLLAQSRAHLEAKLGCHGELTKIEKTGPE
jgi:hypothetical protein